MKTECFSSRGQPICPFCKYGTNNVYHRALRLGAVYYCCKFDEHITSKGNVINKLLEPCLSGGK